MTTATVLSGPERRRRWTPAEKARIVEESLAAEYERRRGRAPARCPRQSASRMAPTGPHRNVGSRARHGDGARRRFFTGYGRIGCAACGAERCGRKRSGDRGGAAQRPPAACAGGCCTGARDGAGRCAEGSHRSSRFRPACRFGWRPATPICAKAWTGWRCWCRRCSAQSVLRPICSCSAAGAGVV